MNSILIIGNGYIADNFIFSTKDKFKVTVLARRKNVEYDNVTYIYDAIENIDKMQNHFDNIFILSGISRPNKDNSLSEVIYANVFLVSKVLDFAKKNNSKIFYPATSLALSETTSRLNFYSYSHTIAIDLIKQSKLNYTICYLHNIYGNLTNLPKKNKMVIDNFIDCYYNKTEVQLINNGAQRRVFTHIKDVIEYMIYSLNELSNEVNLIKTSKLYSIKEVADLLELNTKAVDSSAYSLEDPYILPYGSLGEWNESIDLKEWIINKIKI
jgi:nucleoside-diphosphate-sugar epimerase